MTLTCTYHCSPCGRHFHSLEAFDAHHEHDADRWPVCLDPLDLEDRDGHPVLVELGRGECHLRGEIKRDVSIWTLPRNIERARRLRDTPETSGPGAQRR